MSAPSDLLIVSAKAARRLRLLQLPQLGGGATAAATAAAAAADGSLPVALLAEPVPLPADGGSSWQQERDVLLEVAVTLPTLLALKVGSAALHTVRRVVILCFQPLRLHTISAPYASQSQRCLRPHTSVAHFFACSCPPVPWCSSAMPAGLVRRRTWRACWRCPSRQPEQQQRKRQQMVWPSWLPAWPTT